MTQYRDTKIYLVAALLLLNTTSWADHPGIAFGTEATGPIRTISAETLSQGQWSTSARAEITQFDAFSNDKLEDFAARGIEDVHSIDRLSSLSVALAYGITDRLTLAVRLPYVARDNIREGELEDGLPEAHAHGDSSGLGDVALLGQYRLTEQDAFTVSALWGVKAPTGTTHNKDANKRLETEFQPGSGSWDFLAGVALSKSAQRIGYYGNVLYNWTTEGARDTEIGDAFFYNAALSYRLLSGTHDRHDHQSEIGPHDHFACDLILEINGETRTKNKIGGHAEPNSGGTVVYISPGVRLSMNQQWSGFLSFGIPILENLNGRQTDVDYRLVGGVSLGF